MRNILLMGLTDHEAAAVEIMISMNWRDHHSVTLKRELSLAIPEQNMAARACQACVLDLFGLGMRKYSPANGVRLLEVLAGRPAVLLTWGDGGGWHQAKLPLSPGQLLHWLNMPYTSAGLRDALTEVNLAAERIQMHGAARAPGGEAATKPAGEAPRAAVPAWRRAMDLADQLKRKVTAGAAHPPAAPAQELPAPAPQQAWRASAAAPANGPGAASGLAPAPAESGRGASLSLAPPAARMSSDAVGIGQGALETLFQVFPLLRNQPLMRLSEKIVDSGGLVLLNLGADAAFVVHGRGGWMAAGVPVPAMLKLLHTPSFMDGIQVQPLELDRVEEEVRQRFGERFNRVRKPLDVIVWELVSDMLRDIRLSHQGDLSFQLRSFPNFPRLSGVGPMDVQLAAICARMPQSLSELLRAFPKHEQDVLRFAVLCVCSGLAKVVPVQSAPAQVAAPAVTAARKPEVAARRGFFKSLFDKLF